MPDKTLLIGGNPVDGLRFVGPFDDSEEAGNYAEREFDGDWWATSIEAPADPKSCIQRKFFGGCEEIDFETFATNVIQDGDEAGRIAQSMLDGTIPYTFNEPSTGAEPEFYEEFEITDVEALKAQIEED